MQSVRVGLRDATPNIKTDNKWTPYGDQSLVMTFELYPKNENFCKKMVFFSFLNFTKSNPF